MYFLEGLRDSITLNLGKILRFENQTNLYLCALPGWLEALDQLGSLRPHGLLVDQDERLPAQPPHAQGGASKDGFMQHSNVSR